MIDAIPIDPAGRLRIKFKVSRPPPDPDPPKRVSWIVWGVRFWFFSIDIVSTELGYVSASSRDEALDKARAKWPTERKLRVNVSGED